MPFSPDYSVRSVSTIRSNRKKRTIVVVRRRGENANCLSKKKTLLVSRRPRPSEGRLFSSSPTLTSSTAHPIVDGELSGEELMWKTDGRVLERSILGTAEAFEEVGAILGYARDHHADEDDDDDDDEKEAAPFEGKASCCSAQSQRSRQSRHSAKSGESPTQQSEGSPANVGTGSLQRSASGDQVELLRAVAERYMRRIVEAGEHAREHRSISHSKEAKLLERVGLSEKFTLRREKNVMRQWERRQRDWLFVREKMAAKTRKAPHDLVMSTADEYRERNEEYQLIQNAIPTHEKHGSEGYWAMSLRGYGERVCNLGNIFSGLSCTIDDRLRSVRTVRKPTGRVTDATRKRTWRSSEALAVRKRQLAPALRRMRPQECLARETGGLLVEGRDLLEWAASSSNEYFQNELTTLGKLQGKETGTIEEAMELQVHRDQVGYDQHGLPSSPSPPGPAMEVISPKILLIKSNAGQKDVARATVTIRNVGSTVLFFTWSRVCRGETIVSMNGDTGGIGGIGSSNEGRHDSSESSPFFPVKADVAAEDGAARAAATRHAALQDPEIHFFCHQTSGTLLPEEETTTCFSFKSADPGMFSDRWRVTTVPEASFVFSLPLTGLSSPGLGCPIVGTPIARPRSQGEGIVSPRGPTGLPRSNNQDEERNNSESILQRGIGARSETTAEISLRAVALAPDTREHTRRRLSEGIERGILAAKVEEIVREVVRGVRTPIREEEIRRRQRKEFLGSNSQRGLYFTPELYDAFVALLRRAKVTALAAQAGQYDEANMIPANEPEVPSHEHAREGKVGGAVDPTTDRDVEVGENVSVSTSSTRPTSPPSAPHLTDVDGGHVLISTQAVGFGNLASSPPIKDNTSHELGVESDTGSRSTEQLSRSRSENEAAATQRVRTFGVDESNDVTGVEALRQMLHSLNCGEWDGSVDTVLQAIDSLSAWIPSPQENVVESKSSDEVAPEILKGESHRRDESGYQEGMDGPTTVEGDVRADSDSEGLEQAMGDGGLAGSDRDPSDSQASDTASDSENVVGSTDADESADDEEEEFIGHPVLCEQMELRSEWRRLVFDAQLEPVMDSHVLLRQEIRSMANAVAGAIEQAREQAGDLPGAEEHSRVGAILGYDKDSASMWAVACPPSTIAGEVEGGARARAESAAKAGDYQVAFLALAYDGVSERIRSMAEIFESHVGVVDAERRSLAVTSRRKTVLVGPVRDELQDTPALPRLAVLSRSDIESRRLLLHTDLAERRHKESADQRSLRVSTVAGDRRLFPEEVQLVAEHVRVMLSAKPAAVAIVSEVAPMSRGTQWQSQSQLGVISSKPTLSFPSPSEPLSLKVIAAAVSSLLGMDVEFYESIPLMATALRECIGCGPTFGARVMMVESLSAPGVVPAPLLEEPELSDCEDERLPDFAWGGKEAEAVAEEAKVVEAKRLARDGPGQGDIGEMLAGVVDVTVLDASRRLYQPCRELPWGPAPLTGLTVAGTGLHRDLTALAYLTGTPDRPLLAIVGGESLESRLQLIDALLDVVDILAIGGGLSATFIEAAKVGPDGGSVGKKRPRKWGKGSPGLLRDPPDVLVPARRLLVKARKRGVEVILPSDFVVGDIEVDEYGPLPGQRFAGEEDESISNDDCSVETDHGDSGEPEGVSDVGGDSADDDDTSGVAMVNDAQRASIDGPGMLDAGRLGGGVGHDNDSLASAEEEDSEMGFEYDGETMDVSLEDGIPRGFTAMDIGPNTTRIFKEAVERARAIVWHGMIGIAECSAFQTGTREVLEAATVAHEDEEAREAGTSPVVILCGRSLGECASRLVEAEDDAPPLGAGSGVSHVCGDPGLCTRILEGKFIPGFAQLSERDPAPEDRDLGKVLRRRPPGEDEDEDEDEDGDEEDEESGDD